MQWLVRAGSYNYSWLSAWLNVDLTENQAAEYICEAFLN